MDIDELAKVVLEVTDRYSVEAGRELSEGFKRTFAVYRRYGVPSPIAVMLVAKAACEAVGVFCVTEDKLGEEPLLSRALLDRVIDTLQMFRDDRNGVATQTRQLFKEAKEERERGAS